MELARAHSTQARRAPWVAGMEGSALVGVLLMLFALLARIVPRVDSALQLFLALLAALAGYFLADVATGFVHWFCDTFFEEDTPLIGAVLIAPFREHHRDPLAMTRHGFLELAGNSCVALTPLLVAALWLGPASASSKLTVSFYAFVLAFSFSAAATNVFHRWAHDSQPPRAAQILQRAGLVLSAAHHARHHSPPYNAAYCVTSGWANRFMDRFRVFSLAERALVAIGFPRTAKP